MASRRTLQSVVDECRKMAGSPTLFSAGSGRTGWFFYLPGDGPFECFQVSVSPLDRDLVTVFAGAVDTDDNTEDELQQTWEGPVSDLDGMLGSALDRIAQWKARPRQVIESEGLRYRADGTPLPPGKNH